MRGYSERYLGNPNTMGAARRSTTKTRTHPVARHSTPFRKDPRVLPRGRHRVGIDSLEYKNPAAKKNAITAIAHTLLKIAYQVLKIGTPYQEPGADFYARRNSPEEQQNYLERRMQKLHPGCTITITIDNRGC